MCTPGRWNQASLIHIIGTQAFSAGLLHVQLPGGGQHQLGAEKAHPLAHLPPSVYHSRWDSDTSCPQRVSTSLQGKDSGSGFCKIPTLGTKVSSCLCFPGPSLPSCLFCIPFQNNVTCSALCGFPPTSDWATLLPGAGHMCTPALSSQG